MQFRSVVGVCERDAMAGRSATSAFNDTLLVRLPTGLQPLRHRDFRLLWTGQTVSSVGNFVHNVALPFQILALRGGAVELGIWSGVFSLSSLVFALFGGAIADRFPRRSVVLASDLFAGLVVSAIAILSSTGLLRMEHLYAEAALFGAAESFFHPALSSLIPELVPGDILQAGNALRGTGAQVALLAGPIIGGFIVAFAGPALAFGVDAATFVFSFAALAIANPPRREPPSSASLLRQVREGIRYTFSVPWLWIFIFAWSLVLFGQVGPLNVGLPIFVRDVLSGDARLFGLLTAALGFGQVVTGLVLAQLTIRRLGVAICVFGIAGGLAVAGMGLIREVPATLIFAAVFGAQLVGVGILWTTAVQKHVPSDVMGRVMSIDYFGSILLLPLAPVVFAGIITLVGPAQAFVVGGVVAATVTAALLLVPSIRALE